LLITVTAVLSLAAALVDRQLFQVFMALALKPAAVWRGQVWRLVTWPFVETSPMSLIFACLTLYWFAPQLAQQMGSWRFLRLVGGVITMAGVGTCLIALIDGDVLGHTYLGTWTLTTALVVLWGLSFPHQVVRIYFLLPIRGYWVAWGAVAVTVLFVIYFGWTHFLPELLAEAAALLWFFRAAVLARWRSARRSLRARSARRPGERGAVIDLRTGDRIRPDDGEPPS
jgi:membrane associated rhomboid family serine protease